MSRKTIFRVSILLFFPIGGRMSANAQTTTPSKTVFDACKETCEALDGGFAGGEQLPAVSKTLRDAVPIPLIIKQTQGDVSSLREYPILDYESIRAYADNETIYEIAGKYAAEARMRGGRDSASKVRLDTEMVAAGQTYTLEIPGCSGIPQIGCVAEVNRSFSWEVKTVGCQSKSKREYKCNDSIRKGLPFRKEKVSLDE